MSDTWLALLPVAIASALVPAQILITVLLLRSKGAIGCTLAFLAGIALVRAILVLVFALVLDGESEAAGEKEAAGQSLVLSGILLLLGVALLAVALRQYLTEDDPDAAPPKWLKMLETIRPPQALALGMGIVAIGFKNWVFVIAGVQAVQEADFDTPQAVLNYAGFLVACQSLLIVLVVVRLVLGSRADSLLDSFGNWLTANMRLVGVAVGLLFGVIFTVKGLTGVGVL